MGPADIFRQAMERSAEINRQSLDDIRRRSDETFAALGSITDQHIMSRMVPGMPFIVQASRLDPEYQQRILNEAMTVLRAHNVLPPEDPNAPQTPGAVDAGNAGAAGA